MNEKLSCHSTLNENCKNSKGYAQMKKTNYTACCSDVSHIIVCDGCLQE